MKKFKNFNYTDNFKEILIELLGKDEITKINAFLHERYLIINEFKFDKFQFNGFEYQSSNLPSDKINVILIIDKKIKNDFEKIYFKKLDDIFDISFGEKGVYYGEGISLSDSIQYYMKINEFLSIYDLSFKMFYYNININELLKLDEYGKYFNT
jgi:hypothetical protein